MGHGVSDFLVDGKSCQSSLLRRYSRRSTVVLAGLGWSGMGDIKSFHIPSGGSLFLFSVDCII